MSFLALTSATSNQVPLGERMFFLYVNAVRFLIFIILTLSMIQNQLQILAKTTNKYCYWCCACWSNNTAAISLFWISKKIISCHQWNMFINKLLIYNLKWIPLWMTNRNLLVVCILDIQHFNLYLYCKYMVIGCINLFLIRSTTDNDFNYNTRIHSKVRQVQWQFIIFKVRFGSLLRPQRLQLRSICLYRIHIEQIMLRTRSIRS